MPRQLELPQLHLTRNLSAKIPTANSHMTLLGVHNIPRYNSGLQASVDCSPNQIAQGRRSKRLEMYLKKVQKTTPANSEIKISDQADKTSVKKILHYNDALTRIKYASALSQSTKIGAGDRLLKMFSSQESFKSIQARRQLDDEAFSSLRKLHLEKWMLVYYF